MSQDDALSPSSRSRRVEVELGQGLEAHVVNKQQVGFEVAAEGAVLVIDGFVLQEIPH